MKRRQSITVGVGLGAAVLARRLLQPPPLDDLRGRVAVVTGGSRGLGFLLARELGREGCRLAICARDPANLERARTDLAAEGVDVLAVPCDVGDSAAVEAFIAAALARFGQIDLLIANAGLLQVGPLAGMTAADFEQALAVMYRGVLYPTLAALPALRRRPGARIVVITSIGGRVSVPHLLPYNAAKFAAVGFSEGLRAELAREGIAVTTVVPGLMRTGSYLAARFKGRAEREYALFAPLANLPGLSMDAERAARRIVLAARRGEADLTLTLPAHALATFHGLFPGLTADLLGLANRLLPTAEGGTLVPIPGRELDERIDSRLFDALTALGRRAAHRLHQEPDPAPAAAGPPRIMAADAPPAAPPAAPPLDGASDSLVV